jgi:hypothetical protein
MKIYVEYHILTLVLYFNSLLTRFMVIVFDALLLITKR